MEPARIGVICSLIAAVGYTVANGFLRAVADHDPAWVTAVKSAWTIVFFLPYLLLLLVRGKAQFRNARALWFLLAASLVGQFGGNLCFQWSLRYIGVCYAIPLCLGTLILAGAAVGRSLFKEHVHRRDVIAMIVLLAAVIILNVGSWNSRESEANVNPDQLTSASTHADFLVRLGAGAAASFSGSAYALLGVAIRYFMRDEVSVTTPLVVVGMVGFLGLGSIGFMNLGWEGISNLPGQDVWMMSWAGIANALAFLALTKALELSSVVSVNLVNTSQVAMGALMGILCFDERVTVFLFVGCGLTMAGFLVKGSAIGKRRPVGKQKGS